MKISKIASLVVTGSLMVGTVFSQNEASQEPVKVASTDVESKGGLYIGVNLFSYNLKLNSQNMSFETTHNSFTLNDGSQSVDKSGEVTTKDKAISTSLAKGLVFGGTVGFMYDSHLGVELGVDYLFGGSSSSEYKRSSAIVGAEYSNTNSLEVSSRMLQFNPSIVLSAGTKGFSPYAKFGLVVGTMGKITLKEEVSGTDWNGASVVNVSDKQTVEYSGRFSFGWSAAFGGMYAFSEKIGLFAEMNMVSMTWTPKKGKVTEYTRNGVDQLANASVYDKEIKFVKEVETVTDNAGNPVGSDKSKASESSKQSYSFGSLGIEMGVRIKF